MATAPVVIPYALTQLAEGVTLDCSLTTAQSIFQVPNGAKAVPMFLVFRDASAALTGLTLSAGLSTTAASTVTTYLNANAFLGTMATTTGPVFQPVYGTSVANAVAYANQGQYLNVTATATVSAKVKVDVLGYITFT